MRTDSQNMTFATLQYLQFQIGYSLKIYQTADLQHYDAVVTHYSWAKGSQIEFCYYFQASCLRYLDPWELTGSYLQGYFV